MVLDAQVIAIGYFSKDVLPAMEYDSTFYANVAAGQTVVVNIFLACTSEASHGLASAFGVGTMDLGRHHLKPESADLQKLEGLFGQKDVDQFILLRKHGFNFYYLPNA